MLTVAGPAFGDLLREHRERRRWSQLRLAEEAALDHSMISRLETNARGGTRATVLKLAAGLRLGPAARDAMLLAAGFAPLDRANAVDDRPDLATLYRALRDATLPAEVRATVADTLAALARLVAATHGR